MSKLLVSVIVPVYNCEQYIEASLKSIINQSFDDYEIIVYDDGSTDNSSAIVLSILQQYYEGEDKYLYVFNPKNRGVFYARTDAIKMSKGKYIALHDADDISVENRFKKQVEFLKEHDDIWCVGSTATKIDCDGKEMGEMTYPAELHYEIYEQVFRDRINPMIDPSTMFRKDIFDKLGGYSLKEDRCFIDDFDLWCRSMSENLWFSNIRESLIKYRVNPEGNTRKHKNKMIVQHSLVWREFMKGKA